MGTAALKTWKEFRSKKPRLSGITKHSLNYIFTLQPYIQLVLDQLKLI